MGKSCKIHKSCFVCRRERHNLEFDSNEKGRADIKPYCKHCKTIYLGIKQGLIPEDIYIGFDYDATQLKVDNYGFILFLKENSFERITLDLAERLVQQGIAHVTSPTTIESFMNKLIPEMNSQSWYQGELKDKLKNFIHNRDGKKCHYCIRKGDTLDHLIAKFCGGLNTPLNLVSCCKECNELKSNMSKEKFIRHLKNGDYDYFRRAWKSHVRVNTSNKICSTCKEVKNGTEFDKHQINCRTCATFQNSFKLGILPLKELKKLYINYNKLTDTTIGILDLDGKFYGTVSKENAEKLMKMGLMTTISKNVIKMVFNEKQISRLYPRFSMLELEKDGTILRKQNEKQPLPIKEESVVVFTLHKEPIAKIPKNVAQYLCSEGIAKVYDTDKVRLTRGYIESVQQYPKLKEYTFYKINGEVKLDSWDIAVEKGNKVEIIPLKEAIELVRNGEGEIIELNHVRMINCKVG